MKTDQCFECGNTGPLHQHHVVPESLGGKKTVPLCMKCHGLVHDRVFVDHVSLIKAAYVKSKERGDPWGRKPFGETDVEKEALRRMKELRYRKGDIPIGQIRPNYKNKKPRSFAKVASLLDAEGHKSRSGKPWTAQSVKRILDRTTV